MRFVLLFSLLTVLSSRGEAREVVWDSPIAYPQAGIPFADGVQGFLVWGGSNTLNVTVGRADLWDHRGGYTWTKDQNYGNIRAILEARDVKRLDALFKKEVKSGEVRNPSMLPLGRVVFELGDARLAGAALDPSTGIARVRLVRGEKTETVAIALSKGQLILGWPKGVVPRGRAVAAWENLRVRKPLEKVGFRAPRAWGGEAGGGFEWSLPGDPSASLAFVTEAGVSSVRSARGKPAAATPVDADEALAESSARWTAWWKTAARVAVPDAEIQEIYDYGMYRFGAMTDPAGVPAPLQGPWYEDCQLPPWNGDYHFNINIEMCYWPAFHGNKLENLQPLFRMVKSWWPILRENARLFCGIDDGFMLPHSVDDRCTLIGGFWTGTIDHGCTAWVAQMMFRYVQYSGDLAFLKSDAYPFMKGAMNVYRAMMEERDGRLSMAATTSPEWWGDGPPDDAWGRDASFQLAACHRLCRDLLSAAEMLGETPDPMWLDVARRLPPFAVAPQTSCVRKTGEEIGLFDGKRLPESHRHHSHMAGLVPFDTIDFTADARTGDIVRETFVTWTQHGPGLWAGWSMPWAAMLQTRIGQADAAVWTLKSWKWWFNDDGHASRHNPLSPGFSLIWKDPYGGRGEGEREIMQMDGAMASVAAIQEMLCHERQGVVRLFAGATEKWNDVAFSNFLVSGGFLVSARRKSGAIVSLKVKASRAGTFRWAQGASGQPHTVRLCAGEELDM